MTKKKISEEERKKLQDEHWYYHVNEYGELIRDPAR